MISRISRASDTVFVIKKTSSQNADVFLGRSDYPDLYNRKHLNDAFADGWHHFPDEPDLLHKTTDRGLTFSIHPIPSNNLRTGPYPKPYYMALHNPEGVSFSGDFDTLPQAMKVQNDIEKDPRKIKDHLSPNHYQTMFMDNRSERDVDSLNRAKATEEAIAAGGDSLFRNLQEAHKRRGLS